MMAKTMYWMRNASGEYAHVEGADARDRWIPFGWAEGTEPGHMDQVWMRAEGIQEPARFPWGAREFWQSRGWTASEPPAPVDYTKDPAVVDVPLADVKPATAATKKEKADG
jgi:hypothetical protein